MFFHIAVQLVAVVDQHDGGEDGEALKDAGVRVPLVDANPNQERGDDEDVDEIDPDPGGAGLELFVGEVEMVKKDDGAGGDEGGEDGLRCAGAVVGEGEEEGGDDEDVEEVDEEEVGRGFHIIYYVLIYIFTI